MMERLANAVGALSKAFDREDLKPGDQCTVLSRWVSDLKCQNYEFRKKLIATRAEDLRRGKSAP
jgi:hypothetical protein